MGWITMNGTHIFIRDGESKKAAVKRFIDSKKPISGSKYAYNKAKKDYDKTMQKLEKTYNRKTKSLYEHAVNTNMYNIEKENAFNKLNESQSKALAGKIKYTKKNNSNKKLKEATFKAATKKRETTIKKQISKQNSLMKSKIPQLQKELKSTKDPKRKEFLKATIALYKKQSTSKRKNKR